MDIFIKEPLVQVECAAAISRAISGDDALESAETLPDLRLALNKFMEKYPDPFIDASAGSILELYDYMLGGVDLDDPFIKRCFTRLEDGFTLSEYLFMCERPGDAEKLGIPRDVYFMLLTLAQNDVLPEHVEGNINDFGGMTEYTQCILKCPLNNEEKLLFIEVASMYDDYIRRMNAAIAPVAERFKEKYSLVAPIVEAFCSELERRCENAGGVRQLLSNVGLSLDCDSISVRPSVMYYNAVRTISSTTAAREIAKTDAIRDEMELSYGIFFNYGHDADLGNKNAARLSQKRMKALDDPTRFEIMCALKTEGLCGADIARLMNVTPATISHHMGELASAGLVTLKKQGTKVVYSTNKEAIKQLLNNLKAKLL